MPEEEDAVAEGAGGEEAAEDVGEGEEGEGEAEAEEGRGVEGEGVGGRHFGWDWGVHPVVLRRLDGQLGCEAWFLFGAFRRRLAVDVFVELIYGGLRCHCGGEEGFESRVSRLLYFYL